MPGILYSKTKAREPANISQINSDIYVLTILHYSIRGRYNAEEQQTICGVKSEDSLKCTLADTLKIKPLLSRYLNCNLVSRIH